MKLRLGLLKIKHEPGYAIIIHIHVLPNGEARIQYDGDLMLAPTVLGKARKILEDEIGNRNNVIVKSKGRFVGMGEKESGVLAKTTIMEE